MGFPPDSGEKSSDKKKKRRESKHISFPGEGVFTREKEVMVGGHHRPWNLTGREGRRKNADANESRVKGLKHGISSRDLARRGDQKRGTHQSSLVFHV